MSKPHPTLEWLHVCDYAFRDEQGKLCMIGLFDSMQSAQLPGRLPVFSVAIGLTDGQGDYEVGLNIVSPSGKVVRLKLPPVRLQSKLAKVRAVVRLAGLPFEEFGRFTFRLEIEGQPQESPVHVLEHVQAQGNAGGGRSGAASVPGFPPPPDFQGN
ncbi:MAG: hypothetical protein OTJ44_08535 [Planctomycetota bacterium]|nr:hypothetical protein [Planctomycetota bacterium]